MVAPCLAPRKMADDEALKVGVEAPGWLLAMLAAVTARQARS